MEKKYLVIVHRNNEKMNNIIICHNQQNAEDLHRHWFDIMEQQDPNRPFISSDGEVVLNNDRCNFITSVELAEIKTISLLKREE